MYVLRCCVTYIHGPINNYICLSVFVCVLRMNLATIRSLDWHGCLVATCNFNNICYDTVVWTFLSYD